MRIFLGRVQPLVGIPGLEDPGISFAFTDNGIVADGTIWDRATGHAADGRHLELLPSRRLFAFAWQMFPPRVVLQAEQAEAVHRLD